MGLIHTQETFKSSWLSLGSSGKVNWEDPKHKKDSVHTYYWLEDGGDSVERTSEQPQLPTARKQGSWVALEAGFPPEPPGKSSAQPPP